MAYGFIVRNQNHEIQIDDKCFNYSLVKKGHTYINFDQNYIREQFFSFGGTYNAPIFAIRPSSETYTDPYTGDVYPSHPIVITTLVQSGGGVSGAYIVSKGSYYLDWILFTAGVKNPLTGYGLYVINPDNGEASFSTNEKYMNIVGAYPFYYPNPVSNIRSTVDVTVNDADNNYFLMYPFSYVHSGDDTQYLVFYKTMWGVDANTLRVGVTIKYPGSIAGDVRNSPYYWHPNGWIIEINENRP